MITLSQNSLQTRQTFARSVAQNVTALPIDPELANKTDDVFSCNTEENDVKVTLE